MKTVLRLIAIFIFLSPGLRGQEAEIDRLIRGELRMTFPSIYFQHNSTEYAAMPYTVDSCFKYVALHFKEYANSLTIWRDSARWC